MSLSPVLRLSLGLILLTVSLLLVADLLGLTPDQRRAEMQARKTVAEAVAVQVSSDVSDGRLASLEQTLSTLHERNDNMLSIAVRRVDGRLVAVAGDHAAHWDADPGSRSTASQLQVPIRGDTGPWGFVQIRFADVGSVWAVIGSGRTIVTVILFVGIAGFGAYWLFLKHALAELDPSAVVPDRVRSALDALAEGLVVLDRAGRVLLVNASFERKVLGSADRLVGKPLSSLAWDDDRESPVEDASRLAWQRSLDGEGPLASHVLSIVAPGGRRLTFAVNCSPIKATDGRLRGLIVTFDDLTALEQKNTELEQTLRRLEQSQAEITRQNRELHVLATRDPLTGVLNRRSLFEGMQALMQETGDGDEPLSAIMVDIDHFKSINDRFGHATGDRVIKMLADILTRSVRADDLVGRYGGEEFCVVLPGVDEARAAAIAEQMRETVHDGRTVQFSSAVRISASFGVSCNRPGDGLTPGALVDLADKALYVAKQSGRNRVRRWSQLAAGDRPALPSDNAAAVAPRGDRGAGTDDGTGAARLRARVAELETQLLEATEAVRDGFDKETGLPQRAVLLDRARQAMAQSRRNGTRTAAMAVDVDVIRLVGTAQGDGAAEKLMAVMRGRLRSAIRSGDTVAMAASGDATVSVSTVGNGEFSVLLTDIRDAEAATWIVQRILSLLDAPVTVDGSDVLPDARIGVSLYPDDASEPEELLAAASAALREAGHGPEGHRCLFFDKGMNQRSRAQLRLQAELGGAIGRGELFLEYQPSVDLADGRIVSVEALVRWRHPEHGVIGPDDFVPVAERVGLIDALGDWVLDTAAGQLRHWTGSDGPRSLLAVNLSALQLRRPDLAERVTAILARHDLAPGSLIVDITESVLLHDLDSAARVIKALSLAGVQVALDDFGTGYSSLTYLQRFPIDIIKIDRSFLRHFPAQPRDAEVVAAIVSIAHNLGLRVVAEGVETDRQLAVLQNMGCDEVQGFVFGQPMSADAAATLLMNPSPVRRLVRNADRHGLRLLGGGDLATQVNPVS